MADSPTHEKHDGFGTRFVNWLPQLGLAVLLGFGSSYVQTQIAMNESRLRHDRGEERDKAESEERMRLAGQIQTIAIRQERLATQQENLAEQMREIRERQRR